MIISMHVHEGKRKILSKTLTEVVIGFSTSAWESNPRRSSVSVKDFVFWGNGFRGESPSSSSNLMSLSAPLFVDDTGAGTGEILGTCGACWDEAEAEEDDEDADDDEEDDEGAFLVSIAAFVWMEAMDRGESCILETLANTSPSNWGTGALLSTTSSHTFISPIDVKKRKWNFPFRGNACCNCSREGGVFELTLKILGWAISSPSSGITYLINILFSVWVYASSRNELGM